jgi:ATP-binding cassette subfamily C (CFTR/MRP) protein 1
MLPFVVSTVSEAYIALGRISKFLSAEELQDPYEVDETSANAVDVDADFTWEVAAKAAEESAKTKDAKPGAPGKGSGGADKDKAASSGGRSKRKSKGQEPVLPTTKPEGEEVQKAEEKPFSLHDVKFTVRKGDFVAIVGRIGSGKSSLLQRLVGLWSAEPSVDGFYPSLTGELRRTRGNVVLGGSVAYVPQSSWIMNANVRCAWLSSREATSDQSLRQNILFGAEDDESRYGVLDVPISQCLTSLSDSAMW